MRPWRLSRACARQTPPPNCTVARRAIRLRSVLRTAAHVARRAGRARAPTAPRRAAAMRINLDLSLMRVSVRRKAVPFHPKHRVVGVPSCERACARCRARVRRCQGAAARGAASDDGDLRGRAAIRAARGHELVLRHQAARAQGATAAPAAPNSDAEDQKAPLLKLDNPPNTVSLIVPLLPFQIVGLLSSELPKLMSKGMKELLPTLLHSCGAFAPPPPPPPRALSHAPRPRNHPFTSIHIRPQDERPCDQVSRACVCTRPLTRCRAWLWAQSWTLPRTRPRRCSRLAATRSRPGVPCQPLLCLLII